VSPNYYLGAFYGTAGRPGCMCVCVMASLCCREVCSAVWAAVNSSVAVHMCYGLLTVAQLLPRLSAVARGLRSFIYR
jgi:hypothetical protein